MQLLNLLRNLCWLLPIQRLIKLLLLMIINRLLLLVNWLLLQVNQLLEYWLLLMFVVHLLLQLMVDWLSVHLVNGLVILRLQISFGLVNVRLLPVSIELAARVGGIVLRTDCSSVSGCRIWHGRCGGGCVLRKRFWRLKDVLLIFGQLLVAGLLERVTRSGCYLDARRRVQPELDRRHVEVCYCLAECARPGGDEREKEREREETRRAIG